MESIRGDITHELLEPITYMYSGLTVQRAFITWTNLGQVNSFKNVCNYYHHLESLEATYTYARQIESQRQEFTLLTAPPPTSRFLEEHFPNLYPKSNLSNLNSNFEKIFPNNNLNLNAQQENGTTTEEIVVTSQMIKGYCLSHNLSLRSFLAEFKEYATKNNVNPTVSNMAFYIKHKLSQEERQLVASKKKNLTVRILQKGELEKYDLNSNFIGHASNYTDVPNSNRNVKESNFINAFNDFANTLNDTNTVSGVIESDDDIDELLNEIHVKKTEELGTEMQLELAAKNKVEVQKVKIDEKVEENGVVSKEEVPIKENTAMRPKNKNIKNELNKSSFSIKVADMKHSKKGIKNNVKKNNSSKSKSKTLSFDNSSSISFKSDLNDSLNLNNISLCLSDDFDMITENRCSTSEL